MGTTIEQSRLYDGDCRGCFGVTVVVDPRAIKSEGNLGDRGDSTCGNKPSPIAFEIIHKLCTNDRRG